MRISFGTRKARVAAIGLALAMGMTACASEREGGGEGGGGEEAGGDPTTFVFAASSDPVLLDPAFASDGETFRVARQIFEGLVGTEPGTPDPAPGLASSWESSPDGLTHTFQLREGVTFHDGTEFNADAVCANFERWHNWTGVLQASSVSYYYQNIYRGFAESDDPALEGGLYESCEPVSDTEVTITLTSPFGGFIPSLSLPAFSMQSPTAMDEYGANEVTGTGEAPQFGAYANEHPTGTGPYQFERWERGQQVVLSAYEDYWGEPAAIDQIIFRVISDPTARLQALQSGSIDGYDLVAPGDIAGLEEEGFNVISRDPFNILYLGMNQAFEPFQDPLVRQAVAHAVNKEALAQSQLPPDTTLATQFIPPSVNGYADDVTTYEYDPALAEELLAEAGYTEDNPLEVPFWYPTGVSRPYMPTPEQTFTALRADLEAVGIVVEPVAAQWSPDYLNGIQGTSEGRGLHLLGWTGDYNDTDNFLGVFFGAESNEWGFDNPELFAALTEARSLPQQEQTAAYEEINRMVMEFLPGVPLAHPTPSLAFAPRVQNYPASPVQDEVYNLIELSEG
jgi:peptide/nickel transport system substrate-binding protein